MALAAGLMSLASTAQAELVYKQVGTPNKASTAKTSNLPVYCMSKYGQGISFYTKEALGLPAGSVIKELSYLGYYVPSSSKDFTNATMEVYVANASSTSKYTDFVIAGEPEGGKATTVLDKSKCTLFYSGPYSLTEGGSQTEPIEFMKVTSTTDGFTYTGESIMIFISIETPKFGGTFANAVLCTASGNTFAPNGAYRDSGYNTAGYGINTHSWSQYNTVSKPMPVMKVGYEGERQVIKATVKGQIRSSLNNATITGAQVELKKGTDVVSTMITESNGNYEFTVDDVDTEAVYTVSASKTGFDTNSMVVDIKAGGSFTGMDLVLMKQPVPAVLSGTVINKDTREPVASALVQFNNDMVTTKADGKYSFNVANIDVLPSDGLPLTSSATGYNTFSSNVTLTGDMTMNIEMVPLPPLPGEGAQIGEYSTKDYDYTAPFNPLWNVSTSETIYPSGLLGNLTQGTKYSSVSFYGYLNPVQQGGGDEGGDEGDDDDPYGGYSAPAKADADPQPWKGHVTIYMMDTADSRFTNTSAPTDLTGLTPLFDGDVTVNEGGAPNAPVLLFTADFAKPYVYGGQNIKLVAVTKSSTSRLVYFAYDDTYTDNVLAKAASNQTSFDDASYSVSNAGVPVLRLGDYVPSATVEGTVTLKSSSAPVEGATVTLAKGTDKVSATTDAEGKYEINWRGVAFNETYTLNIVKEPYDEVTVDVTFTESALSVTKDTQLTLSGMISGKVTDKVTGDAIADLDIKVFTAGNTPVDIDASEAKTADDGTYMVNISDAAFAEYSVEISGGKYIPQKKNVTFSAEALSIEDVDFEMEFNATVSGKVTYSDGPVCAGAVVAIADKTATTDAEGMYSVEFAPVTVATADVKASVESTEAYSGTVDLTSGAEITCDIVLTIAGIDAIAGEGRTVDVYGIDGVVILRGADASALKQLPEGIYVINGKKMLLRK